MNAHIKQLAEQAGFYFYDMHDIDGQDLGETVEADSWSAAEKFAELIISQCIEVAQRERNPQNLNYKPSDRFVESLKLHFNML